MLSCARRFRPDSGSKRAWHVGFFFAVFLLFSSLGGNAAEQAVSWNCTGDDFIEKVIRSMPPGYEIPCDHVVIIRNLDVFALQSPELRAQPELAQQVRDSLAFTFNSHWPIYFNRERYKVFADAYVRTHEDAILWDLVAVAGHELTHATGHPRESDALLTELSLISRFLHEGKIPARFRYDLDGLERQFIAAVQAEQIVSH